MYAIVCAFCEMPNVNAPYPCCHSKCLVWVSFNHREEAPFINCTAFASATVADKDNRIWT